MRDDAFLAACRFLGVPRDADRSAVDEAYRERRLLYTEDNLATYSLFSRDELDEQMERLRVAYRRIVEVLDKEDKERALLGPAAPAAPAEPEAPAQANLTFDRDGDESAGGDEDLGAPADHDTSSPRSIEPGSSSVEPGLGTSDTRNAPEPAAPAEKPSRAAPAPFEVGESPGEYLRRCRESQGLSIAELATETRIGPRHLQALESDEFSDLQAEVYVRGFATTYSRALKASPIEEIVKAFLAIFRSA